MRHGSENDDQGRKAGRSPRGSKPRRPEAKGGAAGPRMPTKARAGTSVPPETPATRVPPGPSTSARPERSATAPALPREFGADIDASDSDVPTGAATAPILWKGFRLSPFQVEAVAAIRAGHNVLVSAPTGAGKTLVAEYAIEDAVRRGKRCIYTSPIKALSNQKYRDFRDDPQIDVGLMTGDVTIRPEARVLIMTTEILRNAIFDNPRMLEDLEYVVFDEVHYMDDFERGSVWEESLIFAPHSVRFICLSATISNVNELGAWLTEIREREMVVIQSTQRPVPLEHHLYTARSGVFELGEIERVRKREIERAGSMGKAGREHRPRAGGRDAHRGRGASLVEVPSPVPLFDELQGRGLLPLLCFAFSRKDCERLARWNEHRELLAPEEKERMRGLQQDLIGLFQLDAGFLEGELMSMARRGVGYHHAGMLPIHKEIVERLFTSGLLRMLFTTETFALGINMPARTVVFYTLRKFDGVTFDYMQTRDYLQMAGRAGRQGIDDVGLVFSLLSPKDVAEAPLKKLLAGRPEPVESRFRLSFSSILHLVGRLGRARVPAAWEQSFNQFQHRAGTQKQIEKNRREQRRLIEAHLAFLDELGYLEGDELTARGKIGKQINGYELQITELLFRGTLENLSCEELALVFVGLVFEERRRGEQSWISAKLHGDLRTRVSREVHSLAGRAADFGIATPIKVPDWGLTPALLEWMNGASFEALEEHTDATAGDLVRTFRMSVQLMRQVRRAIDPTWDLHGKLKECQEAMNRDVVDARRQLELG